MVVGAAGAVIACGLWLSGAEMVWQAISAMGTAVFWIAGIVLMYPLMLWVWIGELREGLRVAAAWQAAREADRAAAVPGATQGGKR